MSGSEASCSSSSCPSSAGAPFTRSIANGLSSLTFLLTMDASGRVAPARIRMMTRVLRPVLSFRSTAAWSRRSSFLNQGPRAVTFPSPRPGPASAAGTARAEPVSNHTMTAESWGRLMPVR